MTGKDAEKGVSRSSSPTAAKSDGAVQKPLRGWRLGGVLFSLALGLLLATIETSITATALVTIGEYFKNSVTVTWVVLAYLLSYMGFAVIFTRTSDGIGREPAIILAYVLFAAFSLGGGLARTLNELVGLRALQGIGGSGLYSMLMVIGVEVTPVEYWGGLSGMIGMVLATGSVLGPVLGGVITQRATWRWIYLFNAPAAVVGVVIMLISWPRKKSSEKKQKITFSSLQQVDWLGAILLLAASTLLVFALQEGGGAAYAWNSSIIISTLVISGVCWIAFFAWISWLSFGPVQRLRAIFPMTIAITRPVGPAIVLVLLTGFPYFIAVINLPQRFQVVNGDTPIMAGVHLLPLLCTMAFGSFIGGAASSKRNLTSPTLIIATFLILIGCGLMSTLGSGREFYKAAYGYQCVLGLGVGLTFSSGTLMTNLASKPEDVAAAQGALSQGRILGGSIGLSVATIILNNKLVNGLSGVLDSARIEALQQSLNTVSSLPPDTQARVSELYAAAFNDQMKVCTYITVASIFFAFATYQRDPPSVNKMKEKQQNAASKEELAGSDSDESTELADMDKAGTGRPTSDESDRRWYGNASQETL